MTCSCAAAPYSRSAWPWDCATAGGPTRCAASGRRALDLFDERGFAAVKIDDIAAAAGVSPSSIYRYFGTKEGLLVADEFDSLSQEALEELFDLADPVGSLLQIVHAYEASPRPGGRAAHRGAPRSLLLPRAVGAAGSVRGARPGHPTDRAPDGRRGDDPDTGRVAANALAFGYFGALEQWYVDGGVSRSPSTSTRARPLRRIWSASR